MQEEFFICFQQVVALEETAWIKIVSIYRGIHFPIENITLKINRYTHLVGQLWLSGPVQTGQKKDLHKGGLKFFRRLAFLFFVLFG